MEKKFYLKQLKIFMPNIKINIKIKILLHGELIHMNSKIVQSWFDEALNWVNLTERYKLGVKLIKSQNRWKEQLKEKKKSKTLMA